MTQAIAIDFDGVIHKYSKGWHDGTCYDDEVRGVFEAIEKLMGKYSVFILSTRSPRQIKKWLKEHCYESDYVYYGMGDDPDNFRWPKFNFTIEIIPFWVKFWNKKKVLGITQRKLPAMVYVDDRAMRFNGDWNDILSGMPEFKTYQEAAIE